MNQDFKITLRQLLAKIKVTAENEATKAASKVVDDAEEAALAAVDEHTDKKQYVHGVGPLYVAKTRNSSQYVDWSEIQNKPSLDDLAIDPSDWEIGADQITIGTININRLPVADTGTPNPFQIVRADDPRLSDTSFLMETYEPIAAGSWLNVIVDEGVSKARNAASSHDGGAIGYAGTSVGQGETVQIYTTGENGRCYLPNVTMADIGKTVYLSDTPGRATLTPPGRLIQPLGSIVRVISTTVAAVAVRFEYRLKR